MRNETGRQKDPRVAKLKESGEVQRTSMNVPSAVSTPCSLTDLRSNPSLMEAILERTNMFEALKRVMSNKGRAGVDGIEVSDLKPYLKENWLQIRAMLLAGKYQPQMVKEVYIPKPNGGKRRLGIPTTLDRLIQQAILQILQPCIDSTFSPCSYGFRPGRSAHQAVRASQRVLQSGKGYVVDIDLEKYFDTVNHDRLMSKLRPLIGDQRVLDLIRRYINKGSIVMGSGEGVPQGGPLSPLLSNVYLDELDKELGRRGHAFVRYADDCKIFVSSQKAAERVMSSIGHYLSQVMKLKLNQEKSRITTECLFLGFVISEDAIIVSKESLSSFKQRVRELTKIQGGTSMIQMIRALRPLIKGWGEYFGIQTTRDLFRRLDGWIRRRFRACGWTHYKNGSTRLVRFLDAGMSYESAYMCAYSSKGPWRNARLAGMQKVLSNNKLKGLGLVSLDR